MGAYPDDVVSFIEHNFNGADVPAVYRLLESEFLQTPRVIRSVLYLSTGSLSLLKHYIEVCRIDEREVISRAEYVLGVSDRPMLLRRMNEPFDVEVSAFVARAKARSSAPTPVVAAVPSAAGPKRVVGEPGPHHRHLIGRSFTLGQVTYMIASAQPHQHRVNCHRKQSNVISRVTLPLVFVLEQMAEPVEINLPI